MHWIDPDCLPQIAGVVVQFLINPHGEIDGVILKNGTEVHFPPHLSNRISSAVAIGDRVKVRGVKPREADLIAGIALETADGTHIIDNGPPEDHKRKRKELRTEPGKQTGIVKQALHGPKGEIRGVLLETGATIRFPTHEAEKIRSLLKPGSAFAAKGEVIKTKYGVVLHATEVGVTDKTLRKLGPKKTKHEEHAN